MPGWILVEAADLAKRPEHRHQQSGTVDHRRVDDLSTPTALRLQQPTDHAEGEEHRSPAVVADHVQRWRRRLPGAAEVGKRPGEGDVVDVVAGGVGPRPVLAPAGHPPVDELRVAGKTLVGTGPEPLHHAGAKPLDQGVGTLDEIEQHADAIGMLEVDGEVAPAAQRHVDVRRVRSRAAGSRRPLDADHLGTHVGEQHRGERAGADAGDLDDAVAGQRPAHGRPVIPTIADTINGHSGGGRSWPMSATIRRWAPGIALGGRRSAIRRDQGVVAPVDHQGRDVELLQGCGAVTAGVDRRQLPRPALLDRSCGRSSRRPAGGCARRRRSASTPTRLPAPRRRRMPPARWAER